MKRALLLVGLMVATSFSAGCVGRAVKEGLGVVAGAKTNVVVISPLRSADVGPVTIGRFTSEVDALTGSWPVSLAAAARTKLSTDEVLRAGRRPVTVSGAVVHVEGSSVADEAFGPAPEVVVRVTVTDSDGQVLGVANIVGRARGTTSSSEQDLTKAFAEGLDKWLRAKRKPAKERD